MTLEDQRVSRKWDTFRPRFMHLCPAEVSHHKRSEPRANAKLAVLKLSLFQRTCSNEGGLKLRYQDFRYDANDTYQATRAGLVAKIPWRRAASGRAV